MIKKLLFLFSGLAMALRAQVPGGGVVSGTIVDSATGQPVEFATVTVKNIPGGTAVRTGATDVTGVFAVEGIGAGEYQLVYGLVGAESAAALPFVLDAQHRGMSFGRLVLSGGNAIKMERVNVTARQDAFYNSIDRKVYNVGKDIQSTTGSASRLLQNIPSVQVDIEGNVSLRGNDNVLILVNGKPSTHMNAANRAMALEQLGSRFYLARDCAGS